MVVTSSVKERTLSSPKVLVMLNTDLCPRALDPLREVARVDHLSIDRAVLLDRIGEYDAYYGHTAIRIDREVLDRARRLKIVAGPSTGTDHFDVKLMAERGIELLSLTREYELLDTFTATAECAWGLLIACMRRLPAAVRAVHEGRWGGEGWVGRQLSQKTLGVVGVGRLGKMVVEYGKAFRMRVLGCDPRPFDIPGVERANFDELLSESDVISLHVHLYDATRGLLSREAFEKMKDGVVIVNTSRGGLIDEAALLENLESGKVVAAGLDIVEGEWMDDISQHPLVRYARTHDNLVITPHIGGATIKSIADARIFLAKKLAARLAEI